MANIHLAFGPCYRTLSPSYPATQILFFQKKKKPSKIKTTLKEKNRNVARQLGETDSRKLTIAFSATGKMEKKNKSMTIQNAGSFDARIELN